MGAKLFAYTERTALLEFLLAREARGGGGGEATRGGGVREYLIANGAAYLSHRPDLLPASIYAVVEITHMKGLTLRLPSLPPLPPTTTAPY